jgi:5,10-methylenetetrahydrofolate reductase
MDISYELNPPKIIKDKRFDLAQLSADMQEMVDRASRLAGLVSGIHFTDSVLGIPRVSGITAATYIRKSSLIKNVRLSCSIRVRDRNFTSLSQAVSEAILADVDSLLLLLGDKSSKNPGESCLKPSSAIKMLRNEGYDSKIKLDLSFPARAKECSDKVVQDKIGARPDSFVTQSVSSIADLGGIVDLAKPHGIKVTCVIMVPSEKNRQSAAMIGLDWSGYEKNPADFVRQALTIADRVLLTSPNSFRSGLEFLTQLK